ncbi:hypothetical protein [Lacinutrix chionoecetis]
MRFKLTIIVALCLLLFACPSSDDDNTVQTANITTTNYAYEGDLYRFALNIESDALSAQIEIWEEQGEDEPGDIENANMRIEEINEILQNTPAGVALGFPPFPPPPPPPVPCLCFDLFETINYIVADANLIGITAALTNENQEQVFSTDLSTPLNTEGLEGEFLAYNFIALQGNFTGNGFLTINKVLSDESVVSYSIPVTVNMTP